MDILNNIDSTSAVILLGMVAGVVEFVKRIFDKDWRAVVTIAGAGAAGALVSLAIAINPLLGAVIGLAASGYITIAQNIGRDL